MQVLERDALRLVHLSCSSLDVNDGGAVSLCCIVQNGSARKKKPITRLFLTLVFGCRDPLPYRSARGVPVLGDLRRRVELDGRPPALPPAVGFLQILHLLRGGGHLSCFLPTLCFLI